MEYNKQYWADAATKNCVWLFQVKVELLGEHVEEFKDKVEHITEDKESKRTELEKELMGIYEKHKVSDTSRILSDNRISFIEDMEALLLKIRKKEQQLKKEKE